ncbi:hypothetical protein NliqN6_1633 [Naganishia liquefaciens]|uniref:Thioredoxin domain-containing protein n=1 Tax=Naganishia liquefaciens TaxID=104408 RepID=A0A8H3TPZ3_9TREE|nr:hypothetical protein NliqN6_1633 [Naganishia liquefaciens]
MSNLVEITSPEHFKQVLSEDLNRVSVLDFWASWAKPCEKMNEAVKEMSHKYSEVLFLMIEADVQDEIAESFDIEEVPSFLILRGHTLLARHAGSNAQLLMSLLNQHTNTPQAIQPLSTTTQSPAAPTAPIAPANETEEQLDERCRQLMNKHKVVLFMKGNPSAPKCGFSRQTVGLLREKGVEFAWFDILSDQAVRERLKKLNDWPTFPQIILNGELIGGLDIFRESLENGEWDEMYADAAEEPEKSEKST